MELENEGRADAPGHRKSKCKRRAPATGTTAGCWLMRYET